MITLLPPPWNNQTHPAELDPGRRAWIFTHSNAGGEIPVNFLGPRFGKQLKTQPTFLEDKLHTAESTYYPLLYRQLCAFQAGSAGRAKCSYFYKKLTHSSRKTKVWYSPSVLKTRRRQGREFQIMASIPFHLSKCNILVWSLCSGGITETCLMQLPSSFPSQISWRPSVEVTSFKAHHNHKLMFYSCYCPFETWWQFSISLFTTSPTSNLADLMSAVPPLRLHL